MWSSGVLWGRALRYAHVLTTALLAGVQVEAVVQLQAVHPQVHDDTGLPAWTISVVLLLTLLMSVWGASVTPWLSLKLSPRWLAVWSSLATAGMLYATAELATSWWLLAAFGVVTGLVGQSALFAEARVLEQDRGPGRWARRVWSRVWWTAGWVAGIGFGKGLDSFFADGPAEAWRNGFLAQAVAAALIGVIFWKLVPPGWPEDEPDEETEQVATAQPVGWLAKLVQAIASQLDKLRLRPPRKARGLGRMHWLTIAVLVLFDNSATTMLDLKGFGVSHLWMLTTTFVPGALLAAVGVALLRTRPRGVLITCLSIAVIWPLVGLAFALPKAGFLRLLWSVELELERVTTTFSGGLVLLLISIKPDRERMSEPAAVAYVARCRALGLMLGTALQVAVFLSYEHVGVSQSTGLAVAGSVLGLLAAGFIARSLSDRDPRGVLTYAWDHVFHGRDTLSIAALRSSDDGPVLAVLCQEAMRSYQHELASYRRLERKDVEYVRPPRPYFLTTFCPAPGESLVVRGSGNRLIASVVPWERSRTLDTSIPVVEQLEPAAGRTWVTDPSGVSFWALDWHSDSPAHVHMYETLCGEQLTADLKDAGYDLAQPDDPVRWVTIDAPAAFHRGYQAIPRTYAGVREVIGRHRLRGRRRGRHRSGPDLSRPRSMPVPSGV